MIVDDEKHTREGLQQALSENYDVSLAASADEAFNLMDSQPFDVVITDLRMPGKSGLKVIDRALALPNRPAVLMMTAYGNIETAVEVMKRGAVDFLTKPVNIERLEVLIQRALKTRTLEVEVRQLHERLDEKFAFEGLVGNSPRLRALVDQVRLAAPLPRHEPDRGRVGHRQGDGGPGGPPGQRPRTGAVRAGPLRGPLREPPGERDLRA